MVVLLSIYEQTNKQTNKQITIERHVELECAVSSEVGWLGQGY